MRFVVYGAGAIGGVLGGVLAGAGHDVVLIARGAHLAAIRRDGLVVRTPDSSITYRLPAVAAPDEVDWRPDDVVLLAVKSMDTADALRALAACADPATAVVCVQNGVANEPAALRMFANVYGVCVIMPAAHLAPGVVTAYSAPVLGMLDIGRYPERREAGRPEVEPGAERIAAAFRSAGFRAEPRPDIMRWKYAKLLTNLTNAIEAICGPVPGIAEPARRVRAEGEAVLRAAGIPFASEAEDDEHRGDALRIRPVAGEERGGGSSWQSLARGTGSIESDYLNGEIVLLGRQSGIRTPVNEHARRLANASARDGVPPGRLTPEEFLAGIV
jgi:2-dehydropantoate 2-reductase